MGKTVIIAEKPSVARDIARVLDVRNRANGYLYSQDFVVTWALGHLVTLMEPDEMDPALKRWSFAQLPIMPDVIPLKVVERTRDQFEIVRSLISAEDVERLICATDSGREGELIFRYLYQMSQCNKPFDRLWISSMTDEAIKEGFSRLRPGKDYDALYQSARCRSEADWLVGMNGSRAFTLRYHARLSVGRVQTPTLAILVRRKREIAAFDAREYREVLATFTPAAGVETESYVGTWFDPATQETKIFDQETAKTLARSVSGKTAVVTEVERQQKHVPPPQLYDLTTLQRDANRMLGFSAAKTLEIAQSLYERYKVLTYPRTDSRYLPMDMLPRVQQSIRMLTQTPYAPFAQPLVAIAQLPAGKRFFDDTQVSDHHAIVPTTNRPGALPTQEQQLYDLVVRRTLSIFYPDYVYDSTKLITSVSEHRFISRGAVPVKAGWKEVYASLKMEADEKEQEKAEKEGEGIELPPVEQGDARHVLKAESRKKKTRPPSTYTENTLLSAMENAGKELEDEELRSSMKGSGLGTPATRAAIIERLLSVGYIERKGKSLVATEKGEQLIDVVPSEIASPEITGRWEKGLSDIAKGSLVPELFMKHIREYTRSLIGAAQTARRDIVFQSEHKDAAPKTTDTKAAASSTSKTQEKTQAAKAPSKRSTATKSATPKATAETKSPTPKRSPAKSVPVREEAQGTAKQAPRSAVQPKASAPAQNATPGCPFCGADILETARAFGCSRWQSGCKFVIQKDALQSVGGPPIHALIMMQLLKQHRCAVPGGEILLAQGQARWQPTT